MASGPVPKPVSDPAFNGASWEAVKSAVPADDRYVAVLFIADSVTFTAPDHPILVVDLMRISAGRRSGASRPNCGASTTT